MKMFRKALSIILMLVLLSGMSGFSVLAEDSSSTSSGSGGGGGVVIPGVTFKTYTVKGIISLPSGVVAPQGGLDVYSAFGGMTFDTPYYSMQQSALTSESVSAYEGYMPVTYEESDILYESYPLTATIPEGASSVYYEHTIKLSSNYQAFYGKFWIYDNKGCAISHQMTIANLVLVQSNVSEYNNVNVTLTQTTGIINGTIDLPSDYTLEDDLDVYVMAENASRTFITKTSIASGQKTGVFSLNVDTNAEYTVSYYIPSSTNPKLQKVKPEICHADESILLETSFTLAFELTLQPMILGTISLPNNAAAPSGGIEVTVNANSYSVKVTIPEGENSVPYQIGSSEYTNVDLNYEVNNSYKYIGGYNYVYVETEDIPDINLELVEVYTIYGTFTLPPTVTMSEYTYFGFTVYAENLDYNLIYESDLIITSYTKQAEYEIKIPLAEIGGQWVLYYNFSDVVTMPTSPKIPVKYYSGSTGGGGSGGGSSTGYQYKKPEALVYGYNFYFTQNGISSKQENKAIYVFEGESLNINKALLAKGDEPLDYYIGGYFSSAIKIPDNRLSVSLINLGDNSEQVLSFQYTGGNEPYVFKTQTIGDFIVKYNINGEIYYYAYNYLTTSVENATILSTANKPIQYTIDVYYENTFPVRAEAACYNKEYDLRVYDIKGNLVQTIPAYNTSFRINITPFILGIENLYFSGFDGYTFYGLTKNFAEAEVVNTQYVDRLTRSMSIELDTYYDGVIGEDENATYWLDEGNYTEPILNGSAFEITTPQELAWVSYKVLTGSTFVNKTVKLMNDIDLSAHAWTPIGGFNGTMTDTSKTFSGTFDGQGFCLNGLNIGSGEYNSNYEYCGLFGYMYQSIVSNVTIKNATVYSNNSAAILSANAEDCIIKNCSVQGEVKGGSFTGGLVGMISANTSISRCVSVAKVTGAKSVGGLIGYSFGTVNNSYSISDVNGTGGQIGGLVGYFDSGYITNCYTQGSASGEYCVGGLIGSSHGGTVADCYSQSGVSGKTSVGGLIGEKYYGSISDCYWSLDKPQTEDGFTLSNSSKKGIGNTVGLTTSLSSAQMKMKENFNGWDFDNIWSISNEYPVLKWQLKGTLSDSYTISDISFMGDGVTLNITKTFEKAQINTLTFALYDTNGALLDTIGQDLTMDMGTKQFTSTRGFIYPNDKTPHMIKVFIWDNLSGMKPLSAMQSIAIHPVS